MVRLEQRVKSKDVSITTNKTLAFSDSVFSGQLTYYPYSRARCDLALSSKLSAPIFKKKDLL